MLIDVGYFTPNSIVRNRYILWQWLVAPMFYLFAHFFLQKGKIAKQLWCLLVPPFFIIALVHIAQFLYQKFVDPHWEITQYYEKGLFLLTNMLSFIHIPYIIYRMYIMIIYHEHKHTLNKIKEEKDWLKGLIFTGIGIVSIGAIIGGVIFVFDFKKSYIAYSFFISLSAWIYWVAYVGINKTVLYAKKSKINSETSSKHSKGHEVFKKIDTFIKKEQKYLSLEISLEIVAQQFNISSGYLSQLINKYAFKNFNDYINELRVKKSQELLTNPEFSHYKIESIGLECGFKSKSNFYTAFKKYTGIIPNQYKNEKKKS